MSADPADQRPHPPGYLFYLAVAAFLRVVLGDSNTALVALSIVASAGATVAVFLLARRFARAELAGFVALAFAFDPLVWAHGEIALPYIVLALGATGLALLFWDACHGGPGRLLGASVAFGLAAGFRQDLLLLLGPRWLWAAVRHGPRAFALGAIGIAAAGLTRLVPSALLSGGVGAYLGAIAAQSGTITGQSIVSPTGADALSYNLRFTVLALGWGLLAAGLPLCGLLLAPVLHWSRRPRPIRIAERGAFFLTVDRAGSGRLPGLDHRRLGIRALDPPGAVGPVRGAPGARAWPGARPGPRRVAWARDRDRRGGGAGLCVPTGALEPDHAVHARFQHPGSCRIHPRARRAGSDSAARARGLSAGALLPWEYRTWLDDPGRARSGDPKSDVAGATVVSFTPGLVLRQPVATLGVNVGGEKDRLRYVPAPAAAVQLFGVDPIAREP